MAKLLNNIKFKNNLIKWIIIYTIGLLLVTTIATYSRYITSSTMTTAARAAMFHVEMTKLACQDFPSDTNTTCLDDATTSSRSSKYVSMYFMVDTTKIEVKSLFHLIITINDSKFKIFKIYDVTNATNNKEVTFTKSHNQITVEDNIDLNNHKGSIKKYKLVMIYNDEQATNSYTNDNIITLGYSAKQI